MQGKIYLIATPIGNLEDITLRAIKTLKNVDIIVAEDTRKTLKLLNHLQISKPLIAYHRHSEEEKLEKIIQKVLKGETIAVVSDAGTPCISDPGEEIVKKAIQNNISIIPIPGPCALITGLIASGIETKEFTFIGFLPTNKKARDEKLEEIKTQNKTVIIYEAPHKILKTLNELSTIIKSRQMVIARELTKIHEEYIRGSIEEIIQKIKEPKGEYVIIIEKNNEKQENPLIELTLEQHYKYYEQKGLEKKEIIKQIAKDRNKNKNEIYKHFINKKDLF